MNKFFRSMRRFQIWAVIMGVTANFALQGGAIVLQKLIDAFSQGNYSAVSKYGLEDGILLIVGAVCISAMQYSYRYMQTSGSFPLRNSVFGKMIMKPFSVLNNYKKGDLAAILTEDTSKISLTYTYDSANAFVMLVQVILCIGIITYYNPIIALISVLVSIGGMFFVNFIGSRIGTYEVEFQNVSGDEQSKLLNVFENLSTVKMLGKENYVQSGYGDILERKDKISRKESRLYAVYAGIMLLCFNSLPLLSLLLSVPFLIQGRMSIGAAIAVYTEVSCINEPMGMIGMFFNDRKISKSLEEKDKEFIESDDEKAEPVEKAVNKTSDEKFSSLEFASEYYQMGDKKLLQNIRFSIEPGKIYAITGESGTGKSTILNLITGSVPAGQTCSVELNKQRIGDMDPESIYAVVKEAGQKNLLFADTIRENICLGDEFSVSDYNEAVSASCLDTVISNKGESFRIDDKAGNISGGEAQRINICRMLIRKPSLLLLDEPTSALDESTAKSMTERIISYVKKYNMTLIVVTHRRDFSEKADQIIQIG